jgi:FO synthase
MAPVPAFDPQDLLLAPLPELMAEAGRRRDAAHGDRVTFSPKVFIPLTMLCRDRCGYCTFAKPPARLDSPYLELDVVLATARAGRAAGCWEALFTLGENPEERYPAAREWLAARGYASTVDYLVAAAAAVLAETGMLPHANAGALPRTELERLRAVSPSQGMMLESLAARLGEPGGPHHRAPDKTPERRLATLEAAGQARIPFTTGLLVGFGETREERIETLLAIAASHARHGHVQEVIVQNFLPKPGTGMTHKPPCPQDEMLWTVAVARLLLDPSIHLQAPPNLASDMAALLDAGIDDWGGVSPLTPDHVNPERPWPELDRLRLATEAGGKVLAPRLTVYPEYVRRPGEWLHPDVRFAVQCASDGEGMAREHAWSAGGTVPPPDLLGLAPGGPGVSPGWPAPRAGGPVGEVLAGVELGQQVGVEEIVTLLGARGPELAAVCAVADDLRRRAVGDVVTFVRNRNINYTNVCTFKCRFCAFSKGPLSLNLRGDPYLLDFEEIQRRVVEAVDCGATEVCLQGGIHPSFDGDYYLEVTRAVKAVAPQIHVHGFTALEVFEGARRLGMGLPEYLARLKSVGLATLPGTAAEILDDDVRAIICPDKVTTDEWLEVHRVAHSIGLRSNVTIMFGHVEEPVHVARHLVRARALQAQTGGFTEVVPLPFVHMASPIYLQKKARPGPTFREALLIHAVSRIAMTGLIDNIQCSWVKLGLEGARQALRAGCNDLGGTLMNENISRAAGAEHGQGVEEEELAEVVAPLGRPLEQRTTLYGRVRTRGRRPVALTPSGTPVTIGRA